MTAINAFTDHDFAYLSTDGAAYNCDTGVMVSDGDKAATFPALSLVVAVSGRAPIGMFVGAINRTHSLLDDPTQTSVLAALVPAMRACRRELARSRADERAGRNVVVVVAAFYDRVRGEPRVLRAYSDGAPGEDDAGAFKLHEVEGWTMPALSPAEQAAAFPTGYTVAPELEMTAMLTIQREKDAPQVHGGRAVGGTCYFYRVGREGVDARPLLAFPDQIGERVNPTSAPPVSLGGACQPMIECTRALLPSS